MQPLLPLLVAVLLCASATALLGEPDSAELSSTESASFYKELARKAVRHLNNATGAEHYWRLEKVVGAKRQLVAGLKYKLTFTIAQTHCQRGGADDHLIALNLCVVEEQAPRQLCHYEVRVSEWLRGEQYVNMGCQHAVAAVAAKPTRHAHQHRRHQGGNASTLAERMLNVAGRVKARDAGVWQLFAGFVQRYARSYATEREIHRRFRTYKHNVNAARVWQENEQGSAVYGETKFSDMTPQEFRRIYLPYRWQQPEEPPRLLDDDYFVGMRDIPPAFDWRAKNAVTPVKDQKQCGSCWAFSVTGNIEGQWAKRTGKLVSLSEQELLDCDVVDAACNGGLPLNAYKEIIRIGGLEPENEYPYDAHKEQCHLARQDIAVYINDSVKLPSDEGKMAIWLFKNGPISIGLNAMPMQYYRHGVSHPWKIFCEPYLLDHGVLIVGYGQEGDKPFWLIKNSWGPNWGEQGYYRLYRGKNVCGVAEMATSALID